MKQKHELGYKDSTSETTGKKEYFPSLDTHPASTMNVLTLEEGKKESMSGDLRAAVTVKEKKKPAYQFTCRQQLKRRVEKL